MISVISQYSHYDMQFFFIFPQRFPSGLPARLRRLSLIHLGDLSPTWAHAYRRWGRLTNGGWWPPEGSGVDFMGFS